MSSITTRVTAGAGATVKGSPLTNAEIDQNFINLNAEKVETADAVSTNTADKVVKRDSSGDFAANQVTVSSIKTGSVVYPTANASQAVMEAGTETATQYMSAQRVKQAIDVLGLKATGVATKDLTGFESLVGSTLSYVDATRVFTLGTTSSYNVWFRGTKTTISTTKTITLSATAGNHYIGINPTTFELEEVSGGDTIFTDTILVASIYLDTASTKALIVGDERHASSRDTTWHSASHNNIGAMWRSGGALSYTLNSDSVVTIGISSPVVLADEDLIHTIAHSSTPSGYYQQVLNGSANIQTLYLNGTSYSQRVESTVPWAMGTSTAQINTVTSGNGSLIDAGENKFLNYWIVATNDKNSPIKAVMGRVAYSTLTECFNEAFTAYDLPFLEIAPMYQVSLQTSGTFTNNASRVKIVNVRTLTEHQSAVNQNLKQKSHGELSNLNNDDHSQYVHISVARTISANHTFSGNNTFQGTQTFNNVTVAGVGSHMVPTSGSTYDLGSTANAWRHIYTSDLHLSNEKHESGNVVDGTRGNWTIQEGADDLYIINNKNGKRYKFSVEEV